MASTIRTHMLDIQVSVGKSRKAHAIVFILPIVFSLYCMSQTCLILGSHDICFSDLILDGGAIVGPNV